MMPLAGFPISVEKEQKMFLRFAFAAVARNYYSKKKLCSHAALQIL